MPSFQVRRKTQFAYKRFNGTPDIAQTVTVSYGPIPDDNLHAEYITVTFENVRTDPQIRDLVGLPPTINSSVTGHSDPKSHFVNLINAEERSINTTSPLINVVHDTELPDLNFTYSSSLWADSELGLRRQEHRTIKTRERTVKLDIKKIDDDKGWGLFAAQAIPANTFVGAYTGELLDRVEGRQRIAHCQHPYLFRLRIETDIYFVDAAHVGNFTRYLNHNEDSLNCEVRLQYVREFSRTVPVLTFYASNDICEGEELTFDYGNAE